MPRTITAAQKRAPDFHKSYALAQTNQKKYDYFFLRGTENIFFSRSKIRDKNTGHIF